MRIPRVYTPLSIQAHSHMELDSEASHHLLKVLRMQEGRELILFNGDGQEYPATIYSTHKKNAALEVGGSIDNNRESPLITELAVGLSKGDRMDWVVQKATELGVTQITPLFTERTEVKLKGDRLDKRLQHWRQVAISACEQCQRNQLPTITRPFGLHDYLNNCDNSLKLVLHHRSEQTLKDYPQPTSVSLLIGPEGGLSKQEIQQAITQGFEPLTLGPRVLRTETAPLAVLSVLQSLWGDF